MSEEDVDDGACARCAALEERVEALEREAKVRKTQANALANGLDRLGEEVDEIRSEIGGPSVMPGSKKALAVEIAQRAVVKRAVDRPGQFAGKAGIDAATVETMAEGRDPPVDLSRGTVHSAFHALAETTEGFSVKKGEPGPDTPDTQLRFDLARNEDLPDRLLEE